MEPEVKYLQPLARPIGGPENDAFLAPALLLKSNYFVDMDRFWRYDELLENPRYANYYVRGNMGTDVLKQSLIFVVTHVWENVENPDLHQSQFKNLQTLLQDKYSDYSYYVFYDYSSIPQKKYSPDGKPGEYYGATEAIRTQRKEEQDNILMRMIEIYNGSTYGYNRSRVVDLNVSDLCLSRSWPSFELMTAQLNLTLLGPDRSNHVPPLIPLCIKLVLFLHRPSIGIAVDLIGLFRTAYHYEHYRKIINGYLQDMLNKKENLSYLMETMRFPSDFVHRPCSNCSTVNMESCPSCAKTNIVMAIKSTLASAGSLAGTLFAPMKGLKELDPALIREMFIEVAQHGGSLHILKTRVSCEDDKLAIKAQWEQQDFPKLFENVKSRIEEGLEFYFMNVYYPQSNDGGFSSSLDF